MLRRVTTSDERWFFCRLCFRRGSPIESESHEPAGQDEGFARMVSGS